MTRILYRGDVDGTWHCETGTVTRERWRGRSRYFVRSPHWASTADVFDTLEEAKASLGCDAMQVSPREARELARD